jgi:dTDP-glucose 4,6-dehydratase
MEKIMTYIPKILLVTGAAGFIGSNFVHYWMSAYPESKVIGLDALTYAGNKENLVSFEQNKNFTFVHADILDTDKIESLLTDNKVDTLVHFAAESHVDRSIHGPDAFFKTNIEGTHSLLKAAKRVWLDNGIKEHRFHNVSTDEVYGTLTPDAPAFTETNQYLPNSPYAASKASSDHVARSYHHTYGLNTTISNCSNNYGPYQFPEKLIPLVIANCLDGKALPIYGDGQQIRDWLFVDDHNRGIDLILRDGQIDNTYNIGGNNEWANIDIVGTICKLMDEHHPEGAPHKELITYVKDRAGHDRRYAINASKIMNDLGYEPQETFDTGIRKTVKWSVENEEWWRRIMDGSYQDRVVRNYSK